MIDSTLVIARYNENIDWVKSISIKYIIYNKNLQQIYDKNIINIPNIGREEYVYIKYIIDHYENLPNQIIFTQGDPFFHSPSFTKLLLLRNKFDNIQPLTFGYSNSNPGIKYTNITYPILNIENIPIHIGFFDSKMDFFYQPEKKFYTHWGSGYRSAEQMFREKNLDFRKKISELLQINIRKFNNIDMTPMCYAAIFSVSRDIIYQYPLEYYKYLLSLSEHFHAANSNRKFVAKSFGFGHVMEFFWMELLGYNPPKELYNAE